ncbi:MAG TPA: hypothetical protein VMV20_05480 [Chitinophagaceae bacterium]|nr:hypothetical protein [Chitinophagaceae bacterium]
MIPFHRRAYLLTLSATLLSAFLLIRLMDRNSGLPVNNTYFQVAGHLVQYPFVWMLRMFTLLYLGETLVLWLLRSRLQTAYLLPAHGLVSNLLLLVLVFLDSVKSPALVFNLMACLVLVQLWFVIAMILTLRTWYSDWNSRKNPEPPGKPRKVMDLK